MKLAEEFRQNAEEWLQIGKIAATDVIDMSFAQRAAAELGPYRRKSQ